MPHKDPVVKAQYQKEYRAKNAPETKVAKQEYYIANKGAFAVRARRKHLKANYGMSLEDWDALLEKQGGKCAICGCTDKLCVDHDHATGRIRGILCQWCNSGLGQFRDSEDRLVKATAYLRETAE